MTAKPSLNPDFAHSVACLTQDLSRKFSVLRRDIKAILRKDHPVWMKTLTAHHGAMITFADELTDLRQSSPSLTVGRVIDLLDRHETKIRHLKINLPDFYRYTQRLKAIAECCRRGADYLDALGPSEHRDITAILRDEAEVLAGFTHALEDGIERLGDQRAEFQGWLQVCLNDDADGINGPYSLILPDQIRNNIVSLHQGYVLGVSMIAEQTGLRGIIISTKLRSLAQHLETLEQSSQAYTDTIRRLGSGQPGHTPA